MLENFELMQTVRIPVHLCTMKWGHWCANEEVAGHLWNDSGWCWFGKARASKIWCQRSLWTIAIKLDSSWLNLLERHYGVSPSSVHLSIIISKNGCHGVSTLNQFNRFKSMESLSGTFNLLFISSKIFKTICRFSFSPSFSSLGSFDLQDFVRREFGSIACTKDWQSVDHII